MSRRLSCWWAVLVVLVLAIVVHPVIRFEQNVSSFKRDILVRVDVAATSSSSTTTRTQIDNIFTKESQGPNTTDKRQGLHEARLDNGSSGDKIEPQPSTVVQKSLGGHGTTDMMNKTTLQLSPPFGMEVEKKKVASICKIAK